MKAGEERGGASAAAFRFNFEAEDKDEEKKQVDVEEQDEEEGLRFPETPPGGGRCGRLDISWSRTDAR